MLKFIETFRSLFSSLLVEEGGGTAEKKAVQRPRLKNNAELTQHVVVEKSGDRYNVYTYDVTKHRIPTKTERASCFVYYDKLKAIAAARHLIRKLSSTQPHPALVL